LFDGAKTEQNFLIGQLGWMRYGSKYNAIGVMEVFTNLIVFAGGMI